MQYPAFNDISPDEFEKFTLDLLKSEFELESLEASNREVHKADDGSYEIDVTCRFRLAGFDFLLLVECKCHKHPIKREVVQVLKCKMESLGAHKGIIFATTSFQSGAFGYAKKHGIALVSIIDGEMLFGNRSGKQVRFTDNILSKLGVTKFALKIEEEEEHRILFPGFTNGVLRQILLCDHTGG